MASITSTQADPLAFLKAASMDIKTGIEVVEGNDYMLLNGFRYLWSLPEKIIYWNSNYNSGHVSNATINKVIQFLSDNQLQDVAIEVNSYSPGWYASRVFSNPKTSLFSKILFGPATTLAYTLGIYKIFGSDNYDVMSNTIHLRSNDGDVGLYPAAQAKDYNWGEYPVLYNWSPELLTLLTPLPILGPLKLLQMADTAHTYARDWAIKQTSPIEAARTYRVLTPIAYMPSVLTFTAPIAGAAAALAMAAGGPQLGLVAAAAAPILVMLGAIAMVHQTACSTATSIRVKGMNKLIEEELAKHKA